MFRETKYIITQFLLETRISGYDIFTVYLYRVIKILSVTLKDTKKRKTLIHSPHFTFFLAGQELVTHMRS